MAKKKTGRQYLENSEERMIAEEFDMAIRLARKAPRKGQAARYYDLHGEVLRRRKSTTVNYLDRVKKRYAAMDPVFDVAREWAFHCSVSSQTIDRADRSDHITLAAAMWMLDELKHRGRLKDAFRYFYKESEALESFYLPDFFDAWHDDYVIRGMMYLIKMRDSQETCYINDVTASRREPEVYSAMPDFEETEPSGELDLSPRERFNAIMSMIHPTVIRRAVDRFEQKQWEFLDGFFQCAEKYAIEETKLSNGIERLLEEGKVLQAVLHTEPSKPMNPIVQNKAPLAMKPFPITTMQGIGTPFPSLNSLRYQEDETINKLQRIAEKGLTLQDKLDEVKRRHADLLFMSPFASLHGRKALERDLEPEVVDTLLSLDVDDPYETCFAFLYLIDAGSDSAWLYNASMAVIMAAIRKLPWASPFLSQEDIKNFEADLDDEDDEDFDGCEDDEKDKEAHLPIDWISKKAKLYELKYKDDLRYYPEKSNLIDWKLNLPQIVYSLTGLIMPRTVSDYDELAEELVEAGMDPAAADIVELYLQLAADVQNPSKDWESFLQSSRFQHINDLYGDVADEDEQEETIDVEELQRQNRALKEKNEELRHLLYSATKDAEQKQKEAKRVVEEMANEHQELLDLRELIYNNANGQPEDDDGPISVELPYNARQRIVVFGGHDTWLKAIKPLLPNIVFVNRGQNPNAELIRAADAVWIQANALSHKNYYKIINTVRTNRIPVRYFGYASARKCAEQLALEDMKSD